MGECLGKGRLFPCQVVPRKPICVQTCRTARTNLNVPDLDFALRQIDIVEDDRRLRGKEKEAPAASEQMAASLIGAFCAGS